MDNEIKKTYNLAPVSHKVNIFHIHTLYHFLKFACSDCKFESLCKPIKHKREICVVARDIDTNLSDYTYGKHSSFASDDFYVCGNNNTEKTAIKKLIEQIKQKYVAIQNVRE